MSSVMLPQAELEAAEAATWYDDQRFGLGEEFLADLGFALDRIRDAPRSHATAEFYRGPHEVRRYLLQRFPYVVLFRCRGGEVLILAVSHVRRNPAYWLDRLH